MPLCVSRFKDIDPETGIGTAQTSSKEVYPVHIILENKDGIQGSCPVFRERSDITKHVRSESLTALVSLEEALERLVVGILTEETKKQYTKPRKVVIMSKKRNQSEL